MNFFKRLFGRLRSRPTTSEPRSSPTSISTEDCAAGKDTPSPFAELFGRPEENTPMVMVPMGSAMMITDRLSYEYQHGLAKGTDPSQAELDGVLAKVDRLRILSGGMMRDQPLGTEVLLDIRDRAEISAFREALRIEETPDAFGHCACLGRPDGRVLRGTGPGRHSVVPPRPGSPLVSLEARRQALRRPPRY